MSVDPDEQDDDEPFDPGEAVGRDFLDKLLLAIIDGHTAEKPSAKSASSRSNRLDRLRQAKEALTGRPSPEGRPEVPDGRVLRWMGKERYRDNMQKIRAKSSEFAVRSDRELAKVAAAFFGLPDNVSERLRKKFERQRQKWIDIEMYYDDIPETIEHSRLEKIRDLLAGHDIPMDLSKIEL